MEKLVEVAKILNVYRPIEPPSMTDNYHDFLRHALLVLERIPRHRVHEKKAKRYENKKREKEVDNGPKDFAHPYVYLKFLAAIIVMPDGFSRNLFFESSGFLGIRSREVGAKSLDVFAARLRQPF